VRSTGVVLALGLIAALTAFTLHARSPSGGWSLGPVASAHATVPAGPAATVVRTRRAEPIRVRASVVGHATAAPAARPMPPAAPALSALASRPEPPRVTQERPQTSRSGARSPRRSYRSRNRYPGPIPTPDDWEPPAGRVRIGLQAGHWRADEAPAELSGLKDNGTSANGQPEWEVNLAIVRSAARQLEELGYEVDVLPAVVPPGYRAHLFIAVHADGSTDPAASGYRVAAPRRDATGRASRFADVLLRSYGQETRIPRLPTVTRRMQNYYAFNFRRYEHALHPMTIGVILETGFLTSERDRRVIVDRPERAAAGIVEAVKSFPITSLEQVRAGG